MIGDPQRVVIASAAVEEATRNVPIPVFGIRRQIAEGVVAALDRYDGEEFLRNGADYSGVIATAENALRDRVAVATRMDCLAKQHEKVVGSGGASEYVVCQRCKDFLTILYGVPDA